MTMMMSPTITIFQATIHYPVISRFRRISRCLGTSVYHLAISPFHQETSVATICPEISLPRATPLLPLLLFRPVLMPVPSRLQSVLLHSSQMQVRQRILLLRQSVFQMQVRQFLQVPLLPFQTMKTMSLTMTTMITQQTTHFQATSLFPQISLSLQEIIRVLPISRHLQELSCIHRGISRFHLEISLNRRTLQFPRTPRLPQRPSAQL